MENTVEQNKVYTILKSFYDYKQDEYVQHGEVIKSIIMGEDLLEAPEGFADHSDSLEMLAEITTYIIDGYKAPELKTQLIYEMFWG